MKDRKGKSRLPILAAGGIVLRNDLDLTPRIAVIQSRKLETWGLPKGKLAAGEAAVTAARREVLEETGHCVTVHEFLGTLVYETSNRPKVVQFWRMETAGAPTTGLMPDVKAVDWLALENAIGRLTHLREQVFLEQVGPIALMLAGRTAGDVLLGACGPGEIHIPDAPVAPAFHGADELPDTEMAARRPGAKWLVENGSTEKDLAEKDLAEKVLAGKVFAGKVLAGKTFTGKALVKKTWGWFRQAALLQRQPFDRSL